jgi:hypothetical protein
MMLQILIPLWLIASSSLGLWVSSNRTGFPNVDYRRKLIFNMLVQPAIIMVVHLVSGWQVALAASLLISWVLTWAGMGFGLRALGLPTLVSRYLLVAYFGYCIAMNDPSPLRFVFAVVFTLIPFSKLQHEPGFDILLKKFGSKSKTSFLVLAMMFVLISLGVVELVWRNFGVNGWMWVYAYHMMILTGIMITILTLLLWSSPGKSRRE